MADPFDALGLEPSLRLGLDDIESAWRERVRSSHPDVDPEAAGAGDATADLNEARQRLTDPAERLAAWLSIRGAEEERVPPLDPDMTSFFGEVGECFGNIDGLLDRRNQASAALAKALLAKQAVEAQLALQGVMQSIQERRAAVEERFDVFESEAQEGRFDAALRALARLRFLRKWEAGCRERLLALMAD